MADKPDIVALVGDPHTNSTVALCPPRFQLDDGGTYSQSKAQRWIWRSWLDVWERVDSINKASLTVVVNGDLVEGNHHHTTQIITPNETTQERMAIAVFEPIAQRADHLFIIRGTPAHTGPAAHWEETIGKDLGAVPEVADKVYSWWHLPLKVRSTTFDIMHRPQTSSRRPWTKDAAASRQAAITWDEYQEAGSKPPDVVVRSHIHYFARGWSRDTFCLFLPPWQLSTSFGRSLGTGHRIEPVGGAVFSCSNESHTWYPIRYKPRPAPVWTLPNPS